MANDSGRSDGRCQDLGPRSRVSEPELRGQLYDTRVERRGDRAETGRSKLRRRRAEIHGVQQVEDLQTKLERALAADAHATHHGEVDIMVRGPPYWVPR